MLSAAHARRERHGQHARADDTVDARGPEDRHPERLPAGTEGVGEVVARRAGDWPDDGAALEAAGQHMRGEDGHREGLVFGVGGVGPETGHFG